MITFSQTNLHKSTQATLLAGQNMEGKDEVILLATEPHTVNNKITGLPRGTTIIYDRTANKDKAPPRACIVAARSLGVTAMESWCSRDCAVALVKIKGKQTVLVSLYMDIKRPVCDKRLADLMDMIDNKQYAVIIGVDSNAHSTLYGIDNNSRGNDMEDFILKHGLVVENVGTCPTFETRRGDKLIQTHIDVTLTKNLHFDLLDWRVCREYNASDHNTIQFRINHDKSSNEKIRPWSKADWPAFSRILANWDYRVPEGMSMKKLDKLIERIYDSIGSALDTACPLISKPNEVSKNHWATDVHSKAKQNTKKLYDRAKQTNKEEDWQTYKKADKAFKRLCKRDKNRAWRKYKEGLQTEKEVAALTRLAQREERREINVLTKPDGSPTDPGVDTINLLTQTHFPAATNTVRVTYNNRRNCRTTELSEKYKDWINTELIRQALDGFEKKKSPGPDSIKPLVFEHLPPHFLEVLETAYKAAIHLSYTPKEWKKTKVIYLAKPGKETYDKPKAFRPISLSNYLLKGLERLVGWNMDKALVQYPIHHKQHGFLAGKSTESAISNTTNYIEKFIMKKQHCVGVFLDISSAFDTIRPNHVRRALLDHGGDPEMVQWYYNYITHRDIIVEMHGDEVRFTTGIGFPQGGVCSAKFWLIAFDYAIKIINRYSIEGNGYADDCSALFGGPRLDHALKRLQKMLNDLTEWGRSCGLRFNPEKSIAVVFTRRRKVPPFPLLLDGKEIEFKQEVKYLGVTLDSKLHWTKHIEEKVGKAKRYLMQVANITRKNWGPKPKLMRWAYIGIVRPMLCYGAMIWGHRAPELEAKLRRVNRMAINTFANFPKSTPTRALEVILDVMPLHLFCRQEALAARIRLDDVIKFGWNGANENKTHNRSHLRHWEDRMNDYQMTISHGDRCNITSWNNVFKINRDSFDGRAKHRTHTQYNIYTDGSRYNDQAGSGFVIYKGSREISSKGYRLPDYATVFQAEIAAIAAAANNLMSENITSIHYVKIMIDSQAAIQALGNPRIKSKAVAATVESLNRLATVAKSVTLVWIPAHKGFAGNERADTMAKKGTELTNPNLAITVGKPSATIKAELKHNIYMDWAKEWLDTNEAHHTKGFYMCPDPLKARHVYKLARLELGRFVRIITGHNNLGYFQTRIGLNNNHLCRLCKEGNETVLHFIRECPGTFHQSREFFKDTLPTSDMKWSVRSLLDFSYTPVLNVMYEGTWGDDDYRIPEAESGSDTNDSQAG